MASGTSNLIAIIAAVFIPPLGVFIHEGLTGRFWICVVLTLLFFVPGMIYALWCILG
ncbi:YqaE/Pmp3 family membrane protein [Neolewinella antarctica]|uniref:Uncharacterized membrane protein YqaE (UPF0057 family) n=1 Tax=Neolewinella antarctica TaxID=442734 RepID=A0ABX0X7Y1_9BACT|nr:YqaE/Pmp3 family membrane protein [Neolewinella antarctica]NJC25160.1 uncharacterized membrane protein YqaE (UPF0057 family) [Neolewinella antarctica]